jgi:hypothetical protein
MNTSIKKSRGFKSSLKALDVFSEKQVIDFDSKGAKGQKTIAGSACSVLLLIVMLICGINIITI